jgi:hypothetical protein
VSARYRVELASGGHVEVSIDADVFALNEEDRAFLFGLVDLLKERGLPERVEAPVKSNGTQRRRHRTTAEKRQIVQRSYEVGATRAAGEADAAENSVYAWRRQFPDLGPIERRPFDPEAARQGAADALYSTD